MSGPVIAIAGGILVRNGKLLLGRRSPSKRICPNLWDILGGRIETGESPEQTLARELQEEIGVIPTSVAALDVLSFIDDGTPVAFHVFRVDAWNGVPRLMNDEHTALGWFAFEEAATLADLAAVEYRELFRRL